MIMIWAGREKMKSKVSKYWILSNTVQWYDGGTGTSACPATEQTLSIETMSVLAVWLTGLVWQWQQCDTEAEINKFLFIWCSQWCSQTNYITATTTGQWTQLVTNYIPWRGGEGGGVDVYIILVVDHYLAVITNTSPLTASDKWSSKLEFNNPDICIEKKQPEPGVLAGTPINVKICTELAPWLYRVSLAPSLMSEPGNKPS